jgi:hypothetical protein
MEQQPNRTLYQIHTLFWLDNFLVRKSCGLFLELMVIICSMQRNRSSSKFVWQSEILSAKKCTLNKQKQATRTLYQINTLFWLDNFWVRKSCVLILELMVIICYMLRSRTSPKFVGLFEIQSAKNIKCTEYNYNFWKWYVFNNVTLLGCCTKLLGDSVA